MAIWRVCERVEWMKWNDGWFGTVRLDSPQYRHHINRSTHRSRNINNPSEYFALVKRSMESNKSPERVPTVSYYDFHSFYIYSTFIYNIANNNHNNKQQTTTARCVHIFLCDLMRHTRFPAFVGRPGIYY